jgi:hypothetical protein
LKLEELLEIEKRLNKILFLNVQLGGLLINNFYTYLYFFEFKISIKNKLVNLLLFIKLRYFFKKGNLKNWEFIKEKIVLNPSSALPKNLDFFIPLINYNKSNRKNFVFFFKPNTFYSESDVETVNEYHLSKSDRFIWSNGMKEQFPDYKLELLSIFEDYGIPKQLYQLFINDFLFQTRILTFFLERFKIFRPKIIITDHDRYSFNSALILAANNFKIPTYTFIHGSSFPPDHFYPVLAKKIFVWGRVHFNQFKDLGVKENRIVVVGNQKLTREIIDIGEVKKGELGINNINVVILANSNFQIDEKIGLTKIFCESSLTFPDKEFWVRLHPSEKLMEYNKLMEEFPNVHFFENYSFTSEQSFKIASIIIGHSSTYLFDAFVKGKKIIILNPDFVKFPLGIGQVLNQFGKVPLVKNTIELNQLLLKMELDLNVDNELEYVITNFCCYFDKDAIEQIFVELNYTKTSLQ